MVLVVLPNLPAVKAVLVDKLTKAEGVATLVQAAVETVRLIHNRSLVVRGACVLFGPVTHGRSQLLALPSLNLLEKK
jgi:hypothetical protein